jgi:hypothetical protein
VPTFPRGAGPIRTDGTCVYPVVDDPETLTLAELIERSRSLIRQSEKLKQEQEQLLADLESLRQQRKDLMRHNPQSSAPSEVKSGDAMQEKPITPPQKCPVCGNTTINASDRQGVCLPSEPHAVAGVLSYRCSNGHVFLPLATQL